jgi:hypothetical protein
MEMMMTTTFAFIDTTVLTFEPADVLHKYRNDRKKFRYFSLFPDFTEHSPDYGKIISKNGKMSPSTARSVSLAMEFGLTRGLDTVRRDGIIYS